MFRKLIFVLILLLTEPEQPVQHLEYIGEYTVTAYCSCEQCCGIWALNRPLNEQGQPIVYGAAGVELTSGYSRRWNGQNKRKRCI